MKSYQFIPLLLLGCAANPVAKLSDAEIKQKAAFGRLPAQQITLTDAELLAQARQPFGERFKMVTSDFRGQSLANISSLEKAVATRYGSNQVYSTQNELEAADAKLAVTHSTSGENAIAILSSGSFLSLDELVRRNLVSPGKKMQSATFATYDDLIGEQDVVFFAIRQNENLEKSRFGKVTFVMKKEPILNVAYFTPYPFVAGSAAFNGSDGSSLAKIKATAQKAAEIYRKFVFSGMQSYRKFLSLSIKQRIRNETLIFRSLANEKEILEHSSSQNEKCLAIRKILEALKQNSDFDLNLCQISAPIEFLEDQEANTARAYGSFFSLLDAYKGFPLSTPRNDQPLFTTAFEFWELKVPVSVSVDMVERILISKSEQNSSAIVRAAETYAAKAQRRIRIEDSAKMVSIIFGEETAAH